MSQSAHAAATLVARWPLDETSGTIADDPSVNNLDGALIGPGVTWTAGQIAGGLDFDASTDHVVIPHSLAMNFTTTFSLSFWINAPAVQNGTGGIATIIDKAHGGSNGFTGWAVQARADDPGAISFVLGTGAGWPEPSIGGVLDGTWHHVSILVNTTPSLLIRFYVDGAFVLAHSDPSSTSLANNSGSLRFGVWHGNGTPQRPFVGKLDDVRLFSGLLDTSCETGELSNPGGIGDCDNNGLPDHCNVSLLPAIAQQAYFKASNTESNDGFANSIAVSGGTMVVGVPQEASSATGVNGNQADNSASRAGAAYVFVRGESGDWIQQAYLKASNTEAFDSFGISVGISGDTVVVGANQEDSSATGVNGTQSNNSASNSGAAYVFVRDGAGNWSQQAYLKASNTNSNDIFGYSVAISGDTVVVGAQGEASSATGINGNQTLNTQPNSGAAYVFVRDGGVWSQQAYVKASNTNVSDAFGFSVALAENTLVVGAIGEDSSSTGVNGVQGNNSAENAGAAYVFLRTGSAWAQQAYLKASNTNAVDNFGVSVSASGDIVVVSSRNEASSSTGVNGNQADNSAPQAGAAYVFARSNGIWTHQAYLKASNTAANDQFGCSVATSGNRIIVGARFEDSQATGVNGDQTSNSAANSGAAYVFGVSVSGIWVQQAYLKASNTEIDDYFGEVVALDGNRIVIGAIQEDSSATGVNGDQGSNSAPNAGAAYVFEVSPTTDCNNNGVPDYCEVAPAGVLLVRADAPPGGDGLSWAAPFATLQGALTAAAGSGGSISQIWVTGGVYRPDQTEASPLGTGSRSATFQLQSGVAVYGGFACGDDELTDRDPVANETILDGAVHVFSDSFTGNPSPQWGNQRGAWAVQGDEYIATSPTNSPATYSVLPMTLTDFVVEVDIRGVSDGGIWLRSPSTGVGVLLVTGGGFGGNGLYWHVVNPDSSYGPPLSLVGGLFTPGDDIHLRIVVSGNDYRAYLNGASTPATTLNTGAFASGRVGVYSNSAQRFDNFRVGQGCYHVVNGSGVSASAILDGFTVIGGNADTGPFPDDHAGGALILTGSPVIRGCRFTGNTAVSGGAILVLNFGADPTIENCRFEGNRATNNNGAINISTSASMTVVGCTFEGNEAFAIGGGGAVGIAASTAVFEDCEFVSNHDFTPTLNGGGGIHIKEGGSATFTRCDFRDNTTFSTGGAVHINDATVQFADCTFDGNQATANGGAIMNENGTSPIISDCTFTDNTSVGSGGAISSYASNMTVLDCSFVSNESQSSAGGAIQLANGGAPTIWRSRFLGNSSATDGGALFSSLGAAPTAQSCVFSGNHSGGNGGAIDANDDGVVIVVQCSISRNHANGHSGAISDGVGPGDMRVRRCIIWNNTSGVAGTEQFLVEVAGQWSIAYSNVQGGWSGAGVGNIDADPLFIDADGADDLIGTDDDDLHIPVWSPSVDAGDPAFVPQPGETDLDGDPRVLGCSVDMGADEVMTGMANTGDMNGSGTTDLVDLLPFVNALLFGSANCAADMNNDGLADGRDIDLFIDEVLGL